LNATYIDARARARYIQSREPRRAFASPRLADMGCPPAGTAGHDQERLTHELDPQLQGIASFQYSHRVNDD
jgi:hypothetical protein